MIKNLNSALVVAVAILVLFNMPARAQDNAGLFSGGYLEKLCASDKDGKEQVRGGHTACQSYISGIIDYHKLMKSLGTAPGIDFCVPNDAPMKRLQDIVWVYLAKNRVHEGFMASPAVALALFEYYPCPQPKKTPPKRRK